jgi:two-component system invasion response regulator UvrY
MESISITNINKLSPREKEVALHIANGVSTTSIAKTLGIKCNTVSTLKKKIYNKLGVDSSVGLYKVLQG